MQIVLREFIKKMADALSLPDQSCLALDTQLSSVWDSLGQIMVLTMLKDDFKIELTMDELASIKTIQDIVNILKSHNIIINVR